MNNLAISEPDERLGISYDFNGQRHFILSDEVEAIERSGKSPLPQDYALGEPSQWNDNNWNQLRFIHDRPGCVEPEARPLDLPTVDKSHGGPRPQQWFRFHRANKNGFAMCGKRGVEQENIVIRARFMDLIGTQSACLACVRLSRAEHRKMLERNSKKAADRRERHKDGYVVPMNWTAEEKAALKELKSGLHPVAYISKGKMDRAGVRSKRLTEQGRPMTNKVRVAHGRKAGLKKMHELQRARTEEMNAETPDQAA